MPAGNVLPAGTLSRSRLRAGPADLSRSLKGSSHGAPLDSTYPHGHSLPHPATLVHTLTSWSLRVVGRSGTEAVAAAVPVAGSRSGSPGDGR
jgi:hypothetical protein